MQNKRVNEITQECMSFFIMPWFTDDHIVREYK